METLESSSSVAASQKVVPEWERRPRGDELLGIHLVSRGGDGAGLKGERDEV